MSDQQPRWIENRRCDGLAIVSGIEGLIIMPAGERLPVDLCPCCGKAFAQDDRGARAARLVADLMFPLVGAPKHAD
jgi:hypothetical protein